MNVLLWPMRDNGTGTICWTYIHARAPTHTHFTDLTCSLDEHYPCWVINRDSSLSVRLYLRGYSGTAGSQSSVATQGAGFSTRDQDNDNCDHCKCALMLTGGKFINSICHLIFHVLSVTDVWLMMTRDMTCFCPPSHSLHQAGGLMLVVSPTSMVFTTLWATTSGNSTASNGTSSEAPATPYAPPPWWYDPMTSNKPPWRCDLRP